MDHVMTEKRNDLLLDQFIAHLRVERGLAENTIQSYSRDLIRFLAFLETRGRDPESCHPQSVVPSPQPRLRQFSVEPRR